MNWIIMLFIVPTTIIIVQLNIIDIVFHVVNVRFGGINLINIVLGNDLL